MLAALSPGRMGVNHDGKVILYGRQAKLQHLLPSCAPAILLMFMVHNDVRRKARAERYLIAPPPPESNSRQNGRRGTAPFGHPVVRWRRARGGPWLSGLRPDAVSRMRLRALGGGGGIARAGWRGVFPAQDSFCLTGRGSARWC